MLEITTRGELHYIKQLTYSHFLTDLPKFEVVASL